MKSRKHNRKAKWEKKLSDEMRDAITIRSENGVFINQSDSESESPNFQMIDEKSDISSNNVDASDQGKFDYYTDFPLLSDVNFEPKNTFRVPFVKNTEILIPKQMKLKRSQSFSEGFNYNKKIPSADIEFSSAYVDGSELMEYLSVNYITWDNARLLKEIKKCKPGAIRGLLFLLNKGSNNIDLLYAALSFSYSWQSDSVFSFILNEGQGSAILPILKKLPDDLLQKLVVKKGKNEESMLRKMFLLCSQEMLDFILSKIPQGKSDLVLEMITLYSETFRYQQMLSQINAIANDVEFLSSALSMDNQKEKNILFLIAEQASSDFLLSLLKKLPSDVFDKLITKRDVNNVSLLSLILAKHDEKTQAYVLEKIENETLCRELSYIPEHNPFDDRCTFSKAVRLLSQSVFEILFQKIMRSRQQDQQILHETFLSNDRELSFILLDISRFQSETVLIEVIYFFGLNHISRIFQRYAEVELDQNTIEAIAQLLETLKNCNFPKYSPEINNWANGQLMILLNYQAENIADEKDSSNRVYFSEAYGNLKLQKLMETSPVLPNEIKQKFNEIFEILLQNQASYKNKKFRNGAYEILNQRHEISDEKESVSYLTDVFKPEVNSAWVYYLLDFYADLSDGQRELYYLLNVSNLNIVFEALSQIKILIALFKESKEKIYAVINRLSPDNQQKILSRIDLANLLVLYKEKPSSEDFIIKQLDFYKNKDSYAITMELVSPSKNNNENLFSLAAEVFSDKLFNLFLKNLIESYFSKGVKFFREKLRNDQLVFILLNAGKHQSAENILLLCQFIGLDFIVSIPRKRLYLLKDFFKKINHYLPIEMTDDIKLIQVWSKQQSKLLFKNDLIEVSDMKSTTSVLEVKSVAIPLSSDLESDENLLDYVGSTMLADMKDYTRFLIKGKPATYKNKTEEAKYNFFEKLALYNNRKIIKKSDPDAIPVKTLETPFTLQKLFILAKESPTVFSNTLLRAPKFLNQIIINKIHLRSLLFSYEDHFLDSHQLINLLSLLNKKPEGLKGELIFLDQSTDPYNSYSLSQLYLNLTSLHSPALFNAFFNMLKESCSRANITELHKNINNSDFLLILFALKKYQPMENIILFFQFFGPDYKSLITKAGTKLFVTPYFKSNLYDLFKKINAYSPQQKMDDIVDIKVWSSRMSKLLFDDEPLALPAEDEFKDMVLNWVDSPQFKRDMWEYKQFLRGKNLVSYTDNVEKTKYIFFEKLKLFNETNTSEFADFYPPRFLFLEDLENKIKKLPVLSATSSVDKVNKHFVDILSFYSKVSLYGSEAQSSGLIEVIRLKHQVSNNDNAISYLTNCFNWEELQVYHLLAILAIYKINVASDREFYYLFTKALSSSDKEFFIKYYYNQELFLSTPQAYLSDILQNTSISFLLNHLLDIFGPYCRLAHAACRFSHQAFNMLMTTLLQHCGYAELQTVHSKIGSPLRPRQLSFIILNLGQYQSAENIILFCQFLGLGCFEAISSKFPQLLDDPNSNKFLREFFKKINNYSPEQATDDVKSFQEWSLRQAKSLFNDDLIEMSLTPVFSSMHNLFKSVDDLKTPALDAKHVEISVVNKDRVLLQGK